MSRHHEDWLSSFVKYAGYGEAPPHIYWWVGVSTIAGALRRKAYIDQYYFRWFPNFYVILVARPGIISKSTAANIGMGLLRRVPGIVFGPNVVTWPALVQCLNKTQEEIEITPGHYETQAALTINSSELGNLLNPQDREMVDMLVTTWDGGDIDKRTKGNGVDVIPNPLLNIIACTTPVWISGNIPEYMLGGGFLSRCVFVFADAKEKSVAYPGLAVPKDIAAIAALLTEDLAAISALSGEFGLTPQAVEWGKEWYEQLFKNPPASTRVQDYVTRKQTHLHKIAMVLSASRREDMVITEHELIEADAKLTEIEKNMDRVFSQIGKTVESSAADEIVDLIRGAGGSIDALLAYKTLHSRFPMEADLDGIIRGMVKSGMVHMMQLGEKMILSVKEKK